MATMDPTTKAKSKSKRKKSSRDSKDRQSTSCESLGAIVDGRTAPPRYPMKAFVFLLSKIVCMGPAPWIQCFSRRPTTTYQFQILVKSGTVG